MKKETLDVYERPEAEEVKLDISSTILSGNMENPHPHNPDCPEEEIVLP